MKKSLRKKTKFNPLQARLTAVRHERELREIAEWATALNKLGEASFDAAAALAAWKSGVGKFDHVLKKAIEDRPSFKEEGPRTPRPLHERIAELSANNWEGELPAE